MSTVSEYDGPSDGLIECEIDPEQAGGTKQALYSRRARDSRASRSSRPDTSIQAADISSKDQTNTKQQEVVLFGVDISSLSPTMQFLLCAGGAFVFSLMYGYLQELISVHVAGRKFALFLAVCTFAGSALWSYILTWLRRTTMSSDRRGETKPLAPLSKFVGLSLVRAMDLALTNMAMQFLNYPAKTLIKSSKVVFTMALGVVIQKHRYRIRDYAVVIAMVCGLAVFLHADSTSDAVFHPIGIMLLIISLVGDGVINNYSEKLMDSYSMTQDEYHTRLYTIALVATVTAAHAHHELFEGIDVFLLQPGTVDEIESGNVDDTKWPVLRKAFVLALFSATGIFGASCLGAITRRFGALAMALTSTARKATTLFLSFAMFHNTCTPQHVLGVSMFITALVVKSVGTKNKGRTVRSVPAVASTESLEEKGKAPSRFAIPRPQSFGHRSRLMSMRDISVGDMSRDISHGRHTTESTFDFSVDNNSDPAMDSGAEIGAPWSEEDH